MFICVWGKFVKLKLAFSLPRFLHVYYDFLNQNKTLFAHFNGPSVRVQK